MQAFSPYVRQLRKLADRCTLPAEREVVKDALAGALDGKPASELRRLTSIDQLRKAGAFFTGAALSEKLIAPIVPTLDARSIIADPACGAGDLLVACAKHLPLSKSGQRTLNVWGDQLVGRDLYKAFVDATKIRILLAALHRGAYFEPWNIDAESEKLHKIDRGSGLSEHVPLETATHIVLNPPFLSAPLAPLCAWGTGSASQAAVFLDTCITRARSDAHILAILPDVLRSGSRYSSWRRHIQKHASIERIALHGQFDSWTDVHVFLVYLKKRSAHFFLHSPARPRLQNLSLPTPRLRDITEIFVGPVVPHRDPNLGPWRKFICAKTIPSPDVVRRIQRSRRFSGRVFYGPFVVVRRTSRPGDAERAVATIIAVREPVAVENHLLVLMPIDRTIAGCRRIVKILQNRRTTNWLDNRIRCRHLTVRSLAGIPDWGASKCGLLLPQSTGE